MFTFIDTGKSLAPWVLPLEQDSYLSYIKKMIKKIVVQVGYTNIQSKTKINSLLSNPFAAMEKIHRRCPLSMLLYISAAIRYLHFSLTPT